MNDKYKYYNLLKRNRDKLTSQQYKTLKGQIRAGDSIGALIGLNKIIKRAG